jgi:hypothetical protein
MRVGPVVLALARAGAQYATVRSQPGDPAQVLSAARGALGGEKNLVAVKTFVANGRTRGTLTPPFFGKPTDRRQRYAQD